jgi:hypothetical protein
VHELQEIVVVPIRHHVPRFAVAVASPSDRRRSAAALALPEAIKHHITT